MNRIFAFLNGMREFRNDFTTNYDAFSYALQDAYDRGREWAHRLTFRYFD